MSILKLRNGFCQTSTVHFLFVRQLTKSYCSTAGYSANSVVSATCSRSSFDSRYRPPITQCLTRKRDALDKENHFNSIIDEVTISSKNINHTMNVKRQSSLVTAKTPSLILSGKSDSVNCISNNNLTNFYGISSKRFSSSLTSDEINNNSSVAQNLPIAFNKSRSRSGGLFLDEIIEALCPARGGVFLDLTFGDGGHTEKILQTNDKVKVIAVDRDPHTKELSDKLKHRYPGRLSYFNLKFSNVAETLASIGVPANSLSGAVIDAGISQSQVKLPDRGGFHNTSQELLDLRMDGKNSDEVTALEVLRHIDVDSLYRILRVYGQSNVAHKISSALMLARYEMINIRTPQDLSEVLMGIMGKDGSLQGSDDQLMESKIHPCAASTFQALRLFVNNELNELDCAIRTVHHLLQSCAPLVVVTYNKLEDTIVKRHFTGKNIDATASTIGQQKHRLTKLVGVTEEKESVPWTSLNKQILNYIEKTEVAVSHAHWRNARLRTALTNPDAIYHV